MSSSQEITKNAPVRQAVEIAINLLIIFMIVAWCLQIVSPFVSLVVWGAVIAIATYTPFLKLRAALGGRNGLAVILFALLGVAVVVVPTWMFAGSMIESSTGLAEQVTNKSFHIPPPAAGVQDWPVIGPRLYTAWTEAATNLGAWLSKYPEQVKAVGSAILSKTAGAGIGILQFILSIVIAAVFLSNADKAGVAMRRFASRLSSEHGDGMMDLAVATIRSVAVGVLGIAFIQAVLAGIGLLIAGVPAAGLWALLVLIVAIAQLPPLLVLLPIIFYVFSTESTTIAVFFMIWSTLVSFADMVLKPLMLGRGVEAPMLVILLGAIGGMIMSGIIGLFVGAVVLALGYILFMSWLKMGEASDESSEPIES